jgi:hypothetical protein
MNDAKTLSQIRLALLERDIGEMSDEDFAERVRAILRQHTDELMAWARSFGEKAEAV